MKKFIMLFSILLISGKAFCLSGFEYDVSVKDAAKSFALNVVTTEDRPSMGKLVATQLYMEMPQEDLPGFISMNLQLDPLSAHLPAYGPQEGKIVFQKGDYLPALIEGEYILEIDGISYGSLLFEENEVRFYQLENEK